MTAAIGAIGGNASCQASRETLQYQAVVFPHHVPQALDLLADTILRPRLDTAEIEAEKGTIRYELQELAGKPEAHLVELAHAAAYGRATLGLPVACPEDNLAQLNVDVLQVEVVVVVVVCVWARRSGAHRHVQR
jgi:mitochondrial-processing peptidase subunit alpha